MRKIHFDGYDLHIGDKPLTDVPQMLLEGGALERQKVWPVLPITLDDEEEYLSKLDVNSASGLFDRTRRQVKEALQAICAWAQKEYAIPRENGCDFGAGATGFMVEELLRGINKSTWIQVDVHSGAVAANRKAHPESDIRLGSFLRIQETLGFKNVLDVATGLSSFDATYQVERAVLEVKKALKPGGTFLHIQDVRPGLGTGVRAMAAMRHRAPFEVWILKGKNVTSPIICYKIPDQGWMNVADMFRRNLGKAIDQDPEMELLGNHWVTAKKRVSGLGRLYFLNILLTVSVPFEEVSAVVIVARRRI